MHRARWSGLLVLVVLFGGCGRAYVVHREPDAYRAPSRIAQDVRHAGAGEVEVIHGDTLYGIAFRNGMDFRDLAAINGIESPYTIYVGQILKLRGERRQAQTSPHPVRIMPQPATVTGTRPVRVEPVAKAPTQPVPTPFQPVQSASEQSDLTTTSPARSPITVGSTPLQPTLVRPAPVSQPTPISPVAQMPSAAILPADVATVGGMHWRWPAKGTLLDRFMAGDATKQGIDIGGKAGDPVVAASDGTVVYSGSGLVGYGELIIIKHSDEWLSAYGHNRKRLVSEGQRVKAGQPIAEMGSTGAPRDELHFEIRRNGRPVDPQQFLPSK
ncbi:MAG: peptidoglycan DD-metalloendopeptidase family protein [Lysobacteraceae bacterium]